jgi:hypothetical protein
MHDVDEGSRERDYLSVSSIDSILVSYVTDRDRERETVDDDRVYILSLSILETIVAILFVSLFLLDDRRSERGDGVDERESLDTVCIAAIY